MLLSEEPWVKPSEVIWIPTCTSRIVPVDNIDLRFEIADKERSLPGFPANWSQHVRGKWAAPLGDGRFLTSNGTIIPGEKLSPHQVQIPDWWPEYASGVHRDHYTKAGKDWQDRGEPSQEQVDQKLDLGGLLEAALF